MKISKVHPVNIALSSLKDNIEPILNTHCINNEFENQTQVIQFGVNGKQQLLNFLSLARIDKGLINPHQNLLPSKSFAA